MKHIIDIFARFSPWVKFSDLLEALKGTYVDK